MITICSLHNHLIREVIYFLVWRQWLLSFPMYSQKIKKKKKDFFSHHINIVSEEVEKRRRGPSVSIVRRFWTREFWSVVMCGTGLGARVFCRRPTGLCRLFITKKWAITDNIKNSHILSWNLILHTRIYHNLPHLPQFTLPKAKFVVVNWCKKNVLDNEKKEK